MKPETNEYGPLKDFKPEKDEYTKPDVCGWEDK